MADTHGGLWDRDVESATVAGVLEDLTQSGGGLLLVEGPAGIGKTRLLHEVRAAATSAQVVSARGTQLERDFAFGVVLQLFEPLLAGVGSGRLEELWQGPASQARPVFASADAGTGPAGDFAVLHGLYWLTANACQEQPLVLLVDDLQWCDAPSLRYLAYLLPRLEDLGVLVAAALRTSEPATDERLLQRIITDPAGRVLRPSPLSAQATTLLLQQALSDEVDPAFAAACHQATGGNPLLLHELARTLTAEGIKGSAENVSLMRDLGSRAVARLVAVRMARLPESTLTLARAASVLGDHADLTTAAALAHQDTTTTLEGAAALEKLQILRAEPQHGTGMRFTFIHPLVQAAVHDSINQADLATAHHHAARLLAEAGADPERIAAHLLQTPPAGDRDTADALRTAAAAATGRGAPASAHTYLRRCLAEPPAADQQCQVLVEAGQAALLVDLQAATIYLKQALDQTTNPAQRADIASLLGAAHHMKADLDRAITIWSEALEQLPATEEDRRRQLNGLLLAAATWVVPGRTDILEEVTRLSKLPPHDSDGARLLDCAVAGRDSVCGDPAAVPRARSALADGTLAARAGGNPAIMGGWNALLAADEATVMESLDAAVTDAHRHGSLFALAPAYALRGIGWLWRGQLSAAESDERQSLQASNLSGVEVGAPFAVAFLAEALVEQGRLDEAEQALHSIGVTRADSPRGPVYVPLVVLAGLLRMRGEHERALDAALHAQQLCQTYDIRNPAVIAWRAEASMALHALDRTNEALDIADEDLHLARQWGAPRALGRALRISGLLQGGDKGLELLREAVTVLEDSPAALEHAKSLAALGAALRRAGHRIDARSPLRLALDLATRCGAVLADQVRVELAAAGGRPRRTELVGPDSLTLSERRVAELAAAGATNRQIAQNLYVTPKTVEVHLSAVYRKLGITSRTQLTRALAS